MKTCFKCGQEKPLEDFYKHPRMASGVLGKCKECAKQDVRDNYRARIEDKRAYDKKRNSSPARKASRVEHQRTRRAKDRQKDHARQLVRRSVQSGQLIKKACEHCGDPSTEAHHRDYSKPLEVVWLCFTCHRREHGQLDYMEEAS